MVKNILIALFVFISAFETILLLWIDNNINKQKLSIEDLFKEKSVIQISQSPDVYITKVENSQEAFYSFMSRQGWFPLDDERTGSTFYFDRPGEEVWYDRECNSYFAFWTKEGQREIDNK